MTETRAPYYARRTDTDQREIVQAWRRVGAKVIVTSGVGGGFPDAVVSFRRAWLFAEIKRPDGRLTEAERKFQQMCLAAALPYVIVCSVDEALRVIGAIR